MTARRRLQSMRVLCRRAALALAGYAWMTLVTSVPALAANDLSSLQEASRLNDDTVGIVFHYEDIYRRMVDDMADELSASAGVRVVPVIGENHVQSIYDMLYMNGIDLGIVHADVLEYIARTQDYRRIFSKIHALARLYDEKLAIIAGAEIESLASLAGRKVNVGAPGKGTDVSGSLLFDTLGIDISKTRLDKRDALEQVKSGDIAAMVYLIEEPVPAFRDLTAEDGVTLLPIPANTALDSLYRRTTLDSSDFPALAAEEPVDTLSVEVIIASYNWPERETWRHSKLKRFVEALVANLPALRSDTREPAWQNVALQADIPGVQRLALVDTMIADQSARERQLAAEEAALQVSELKAEQERLTARLAETLGDSIGNVTDPNELERMIEQLQKVLGELE